MDQQKKSQLKEKIKSLPQLPGVYLMKNNKEKIIYVGKARVLPKRVSSYFRNDKQLDIKTRRLVSNINDFDFITTQNEVEALVLEANLIKKYKPKYNINLKDDKKYPYIKITSEDFPRLMITRRQVKDGATYIGPYTEVKELRHTMRTLRNLFQYRDCKLDLKDQGKNYKPCFNYQIKKCTGPCAGYVSSREYKEQIRIMIDFLYGKTKEISELIQTKMKKSAQSQKFEEAAYWRDLLKSIHKIAQKQTVSQEYLLDIDYLALSISGNYACIAVFQVRSGKLLGKKHFYLENLDLFEQKEAVSSFLEQYYISQDFVPKKIIIQSEMIERELFEQWLREKSQHRVNIVIKPQLDELNLMNLVIQNAKFYLDEFMNNKAAVTGKIPFSVEALQKNLHLPKPPLHIECFDISHLSGKQMVASSVCFIDGKASKKNYRSFHIRTVEGIDDFKAMGEVVRRKYKRVLKENLPQPDLIVIDGGIGQLNAAKNELKALDLDSITMIGLAKKYEEIYFPYISQPVILPKTSAALRLLQAIRDESHRFAITYHKKWRDREFTLSVLDNIPGIGTQRKKKMLSEFASIEEIAKGSRQELMNRLNFSEQLIENIYSFFHHEEYAVIRQRYGF